MSEVKNYTENVKETIINFEEEDIDEEDSGDEDLHVENPEFIEEKKQPDEDDEDEELLKLMAKPKKKEKKPSQFLIELYEKNEKLFTGLNLKTYLPEKTENYIKRLTQLLHDKVITENEFKQKVIFFCKNK